MRISQRPVRIASGAYDTFVDRFAVRSSGALSGKRQPTMHEPHWVHPSVVGYRSGSASSATGRIAFGCIRHAGAGHVGSGECSMPAFSHPRMNSASFGDAISGTMTGSVDSTFS